MKRQDLSCYEGKRIKIFLKNKFVYNCVIEEFLDDCIKIRDKFDNVVIISLDEISNVTGIRKVGEDDKRE